MADEATQAALLIAKSGKKRSAAFLHLSQSLPSMSNEAQTILKDLMAQHKIELPSEDTPVFTRIEPLKKVTKLIDNTMSDETILLLARDHQLSFLGSLLQVVEAAESVSTRHCIKQVALAVPPNQVPAQMDAKEMVMAALHFLASQPTNKDSILPLICPFGNGNDLEKRCYQKASNWALSEIMEKVADLEQIFFSNVTSYKWMAREKLCPRLGESEDLLLLKGNPPTSAAAKRKKATKPASSVKKETVSESASGMGEESTHADASEPAAQAEPTPSSDLISSL